MTSTWPNVLIHGSRCSYEDTSVLLDIIGGFLTTFINSYYKNDKSIAKDRELQAWLKETVPAQVHDFPTKIQTKKDITEILSHQIFLGSIVRMYHL